jgi:hypothetical protein
MILAEKKSLPGSAHHELRPDDCLLPGNFRAGARALSCSPGGMQEQSLNEPARNSCMADGSQQLGTATNFINGKKPLMQRRKPLYLSLKNIIKK